MKAIRMHATGGPDVLRLEDVAAPAARPGEAVIKIEAVGVNFVDVYERKGQYPVSLPTTPGREAAGTVLALGPDVTGLRVGDRVASHAVPGAYAEQAAVPADRLVPLPEGVGAREGAALMLQGLTAHYLATSTYALQPGDTCLVHAAAGGVGLLVCQIARQRGARVIATVSSEAKAALAREAGAEWVIRYTEQDFQAETMRLTGGAGVRVVYDSVGQTTFERGLACLAPRGLMVLYGQSSGPVGPLDPQVLSRRGSLYLTRPTLAHYVATRPQLLARTADLFGWLRDGRLRLRIGAEFPLARAAEAHRALEERRTSGKVLLLP
jgi:NADPH2:quinone reductase